MRTDAPGQRRSRYQRGCRCLRIVLAHLFSHLGLCATVAGYTVIGALIFERLERGSGSDSGSGSGDKSTNHTAQLVKLQHECIESLWNITMSLPVLRKQNWSSLAHESLRRLEMGMWSKAASRSSGNTASKTEWTFISSLLYSVTVITTIGYGHITPKTDVGKLATIFYALLGIPLMLLCLTNIGHLMANTFRFVYWSCRTKGRSKPGRRKFSTANHAWPSVNGNLQKTLEENSTRPSEEKSNKNAASVKESEDQISSGGPLRPGVLDPSTRKILIECAEYILTEQKCVALDQSQRQLLEDIEHAKNLLHRIGERNHSPISTSKTSCGVSKFPVDSSDLEFSSSTTFSSNVKENLAVKTEGPSSGCATRTRQKVHFLGESRLTAPVPTDNSESCSSAISSGEPDGGGLVPPEHTTTPSSNHIRVTVHSNVDGVSASEEVPRLLQVVDKCSDKIGQDSNEDSSSVGTISTAKSPKQRRRFWSVPNPGEAPCNNLVKRKYSQRNIDLPHNQEVLNHLKRPVKNTSPEISITNPLEACMNSSALEATSGRSNFSIKEVKLSSKVASDSRHVPIPLVLAFVTLYICFGAAVFAWWENWRFLDGAYFCFITLSTIGFGDLVPGTTVLNADTQQDQLKLVFCCIYLVIGLAIIAMSFSLVQEEVVTKCKQVGKCTGILYDSDEE